MEPVTHVLTGACLARSGLNRRAAYATAAMAVAAEFPDIDTLWSLRGPISGFQHHRGITHTFVGIPFEAAFLLLCVFALHRWREHRAGKERRVLPSSAPVRWGWLYGLLLLALLSHLLLDYTNNYGLRPFFPFNPHWYAASIVFIFDPLLFLLLVLGLSLPSLFALVSSEIGDRAKRFRGAGWARAALCGVLLLWAFRWMEHGRAVDLASQQSLRAPAPLGTATQTSDESSAAGPAPQVERALLRPEKIVASPDPISPLRWYAATDFGAAYQLGTVDTLRSSFVPGRVLDKPAASRWIDAADRTHLGRVYLDWSSMPWITAEGVTPSRDGQQSADDPVVHFEDLRFVGGSSLMRRGTDPPLSGRVEFSPRGEVLEQSLDGRIGR